MAQYPYGRSGRHSTARRARSDASLASSANAASFPAVEDDDEDDSGIFFLMKDGSEDPSESPEVGKQSADDEESTDGSAMMAEVGAWAHDVLVEWSRTASRAIDRTWHGLSARTRRSRWTSDSFLDRSHEGILLAFVVPSAMDHRAKAEGWRRDSNQHRRN
jgi:hypothetical protein